MLVSHFVDLDQPEGWCILWKIRAAENRAVILKQEILAPLHTCIGGWKNFHAKLVCSAFLGFFWWQKVAFESSLTGTKVLPVDLNMKFMSNLITAVSFVLFWMLYMFFFKNRAHKTIPSKCSKDLQDFENVQKQQEIPQSSLLN